VTFREFVDKERPTAEEIQGEVLHFIQSRKDVVLVGAWAVNAYVDEQRQTQDVDLIAFDAQDLIYKLKEHLHERLHIAVRVRKSVHGFRLYQIRAKGNRHLVDIRESKLPTNLFINGIPVVDINVLIEMKEESAHDRGHKAKGKTDMADLIRLREVIKRNAGKGQK
jgi:hypothetical protein